MKNFKRETKHSREQLPETNYQTQCLSTLLNLPASPSSSPFQSILHRIPLPLHSCFAIFHYFFSFSPSLSFLAHFNFSVLLSASVSTASSSLSAPFSSLFPLLPPHPPLARTLDHVHKAQRVSCFYYTRYEIAPTILLLLFHLHPPLLAASMRDRETRAAPTCANLYWQTLRILDHGGLGILDNITPMPVQFYGTRRDGDHFLSRTVQYIILAFEIGEKVFWECYF